MKPENSMARRIPISLKVKYRKTYSRRFDKAELRNISLSGALIKNFFTELNLDDKINLTFELGGRKRSIPAKIVWVNESDAGLRFLHSNHQDEQLIDDLMFFVEEKTDGKKSLLDEIFKKVA